MKEKINQKITNVYEFIIQLIKLSVEFCKKRSKIFIGVVLMLFLVYVFISVNFLCEKNQAGKLELKKIEKVK
jgi:hypothetical protein